jgi:aldehyde dehydrogenase (NAD+)
MYRVASACNSVAPRASTAPLRSGLGQEACAALVQHKHVRKVCFTGPVRAGREVGRMAAERIIPVTLELGGKSPNILFADADFAAVIPCILRGFIQQRPGLHVGQPLPGRRIRLRKTDGRT